MLGLVVSSKSERDVLMNTRCLHGLEHFSVYWLTEEKYFGLVPDSIVVNKVDIRSSEAALIVDTLAFDMAYVFDDDLRGKLLGSRIRHGVSKGHYKTNIMHGGLDFFGNWMREDGSTSKYYEPNYGDREYIFDLKGRVNDFVYTKLTKLLSRSHGVVGIYMDDKHSSKKLPFPDYVTIIEKLFLRSVASTVVLLGDKESNSVRIRAIMSELKGYYIINATSFVDYQHIAHAIKECDVILAEDNFGLHLAIALGVPRVGMFGDTLGVGVYGFSDFSKVEADCNLDCRPCKDDICDVEVSCWNYIDLDDVIDAITVPIVISISHGETNENKF